MRGLDITQENLTNQQGVVKNEVKVNVLNQPYGGFPWLDLPQYANTNWYNAHNFYGDLEHLDAATLDDVQQFFKTYYAPNNAVARGQRRHRHRADAGVGRASTSAASRASKLPPQPDISEPRQEKEKRASKEDPLANRPALALGYHCPQRDTPEYYAMGLIDQLLVQGSDSRLYQALVQKRGLTGSVSGGANPLLGNMFDIKGPMLWTVWLIHDADKKADEIIAAIDEEIARLQTTPVDEGGARAGAGQAPLAALRRLRAVRRLRPRQPARLLRAVRRRPGEDQPARGRVPQGHAGADPEDGARVPAADQPHDPDHHAERKGELRWRTAPAHPGARRRRPDRRRGVTRAVRPAGAAAAREAGRQAGGAEACDAKPSRRSPRPQSRRAGRAERRRPSRRSRRSRACRATSRSRSRSASRSTTACRSRSCSGARCRRCA